jgi:uncharacterized protein YkwD
MVSRPTRIAVGAVLVAVLALPATVAARASAPTMPAAATASTLLRDLNRVRVEHNLVPLRYSYDLTVAARSHAQSMSERGYFAHDFAGSPFDAWIRRFYPTRGFTRWVAGENILWSTRPLSAGRAISVWMQSPGHRRNILDPAYREIGVATVDVSDAPGVFGGLDVTIAVTDFGARQTTPFVG